MHGRDFTVPRALTLCLAACVVSVLAMACSSSTNHSTASVPVGATAAAPPSAAIATASPAPQKASLKVQLNWIPNIQHYGIEYADKQGFYKSRNLDVTVQPGGNGVDPIQIVAAGGADISVSSPTAVLTAVTQGLPIVAFAVADQKAPNSITCRADKGVTEFKDIAGKTFASRGPNDDLNVPIILQKNGVDPKTVKMRPIGASSIAELQSGIVDCQLTYAVNEPIVLKKAGINPVSFLLSDYGFPGQQDVYVTNKSTLQNHPDALVRFLQATAQGWQTFLADPEKAAAWVVSSNLVDGLDADQQRLQADAMKDLLTSDNTKTNGLLYLDRTAWMSSAQQVLTSKTVDKLPDIDQALTFDILKAAHLPPSN